MFVRKRERYYKLRLARWKTGVLYRVLQTGLALRDSARLHHDFFALKFFEYNERRKLPLRIRLQRTCSIVVRRSVSRIYCRCSDHSHDLLFYYYCCCCCCMCYPAAAGLVHWYSAVARCCSTSQSQQDYAAAGAFVCVSCLYMFSSKIYL